MKKKYAGILLGIALGATVFGGCSQESSEQTAENESIYGEITEIGEEGITIEVGTMKEQGTDQEPSTDELPDEAPSMLELTGEEEEIDVTEDTEIVRQSMGSGPGGGQMGEAPEKPEGQEGEEPSDEAPERLEGQEGEEPSGEAPEKPEDSQAQQEAVGQDSEKESSRGEQPDEAEIEFSDLAEGDTVSITFDENGKAEKIMVMSMGGGPGGNGGQSAPDSYEAAVEYTEDTEAKGETIASTGTDENAVHVYEGAEVSLNDLAVSRVSQDSQGGDSSSFYGIGAAVLNTDGTLYVKDSSIETDSAGGAGIFSYGDGVTYAADTTISTAQDTSGGIHVAGGGTLYAWDLDVTTKGESSAAIRSDRGSGTIVAEGGTYVSNGTGSPAIYSTADISVKDADLTANGSEAICIEGLNSIRLFDCDLAGNMQDDEQNDCTWNVILYQSMSGDSEVGNSSFEMNGGSLTAGNGGMFYTTNTESTITLSNVDITYADDSEFFLKCTGNANQRGWGNQGSNGADCLFTGLNQVMEGDVIWDSISQLDFYMGEGSTLKGAVIDDETYGQEDGGGHCNFYIDEGASWTVTGDSTLSSLSCSGTIADEEGKTVTVKGNDGTVYVEGDSEYSITVDSYTADADLSGMSQTAQWEDWQMEKPEELE